MDFDPVVFVEIKGAMLLVALHTDLRRKFMHFLQPATMILLRMSVPQTAAQVIPVLVVLFFFFIHFRLVVDDGPLRIGRAGGFRIGGSRGSSPIVRRFTVVPYRVPSWAVGSAGASWWNGRQGLGGGTVQLLQKIEVVFPRDVVPSWTDGVIHAVPPIPVVVVLVGVGKSES
jgi:hypothetical protein